MRALANDCSWTCGWYNCGTTLSVHVLAALKIDHASQSALSLLSYCDILADFPQQTQDLNSCFNPHVGAAAGGYTRGGGNTNKWSTGLQEEAKPVPEMDRPIQKDPRGLDRSSVVKGLKVSY